MFGFSINKRLSNLESSVERIVNDLDSRKKVERELELETEKVKRENEDTELKKLVGKKVKFHLDSGKGYKEIKQGIVLSAYTVYPGWTSPYPLYTVKVGNRIYTIYQLEK